MDVQPGDHPDDAPNSDVVPGRIAVRGAREHNLRAIDIDIPRDTVVAFTGISGSGKSSLAFGTIYTQCSTPVPAPTPRATVPPTSPAHSPATPRRWTPTAGPRLGGQHGRHRRPRPAHAQCHRWIVDMGPGAGANGGSVVASGTPAELAEDPDSLTGPHLRTLS